VADADLNPPAASPPIEGGHRNVSVATDAAVLVAAVPAAIGGVDVARSKRLGIMGWFAIIWLGLVVLMAIAPGVFPVTSLHSRSIDAIVNDSFGPSLRHPLGLDVSGYDLLTRVIYGARASMMVSVGAILFSLAVGGTLGLIAGYFKGKLDLVLTGVFNIMLSMPFLVLALAFVAVLATGDNVSYARRVSVVMLAVGIASIPQLARITRANTLAWSEREFVLAARLQGAKTSRIIRREVLPNVMPAMFSIALLGIGIVIIVEGGLALLGAGVPATIDTPSWGNILATMSPQLFLGKPWGVFAPSLAIFFTVLSLNYLGDVVRARFDVRESVL
jgi:peptide/nickel transport system permease protein